MRFTLPIGDAGQLATLISCARHLYRLTKTTSGFERYFESLGVIDKRHLSSQINCIADFVRSLEKMEVHVDAVTE